MRMNGVGPLIVGSPAPHSDPNLMSIQPVEIQQFAQNPMIWAGDDHHIDMQRTLPPPQHVPLPATMQPMPPYSQLVTPQYTELGNDCMQAGFGIHTTNNSSNNSQQISATRQQHFSMSMDTDLEFSPHVNTSELSSPSSSE